MATTTIRPASSAAWDTSYEWKAVVLLGVGFGLVGLDRWVIASLFPTMAADLGLPPGEIGRLAGILGVLWGVFAIFSGRLSDAIGPRTRLEVELDAFHPSDNSESVSLGAELALLDTRDSTTLARGYDRVSLAVRPPGERGLVRLPRVDQGLRLQRGEGDGVGPQRGDVVRVQLAGEDVAYGAGRGLSVRVDEGGVDGRHVGRRHDPR